MYTFCVSETFLKIEYFIIRSLPHMHILQATKITRILLVVNSTSDIVLATREHSFDGETLKLTEKSNLLSKYMRVRKTC